MIFLCAVLTFTCICLCEHVCSEILLILQIRNKDVLRAVVALLDTSLPDVGPRDVHETVHYPGIRTIILSRDHAGM